MTSRGAGGLGLQGPAAAPPDGPAGTAEMDLRLRELLTRAAALDPPPLAPPQPRLGQARESWLAEVQACREAHTAHASRLAALAGPAAGYRGEPGTDHQVPVPGGTITVRSYLPERDRPVPAVVHLHGGGFWNGGGPAGLDAAAGSLGMIRDSLGVAVIDVDYRLAPEHRHPTPLMDAATAVDWLLANRGALGVDPERISVVGASAGANLASGLAQLAQSRHWPRLRALVLLAPPVDMLMASASIDEFEEFTPRARELLANARDLYLPAGHDRRDPLISPIYADDPKQFPATFIAAGRYDPLREDAARFAELLRSVGVPVVCREYPMSHGLGLPETWVAVAMDLAAAIHSASFE